MDTLVLEAHSVTAVLSTAGVEQRRDTAKQDATRPLELVPTHNQALHPNPLRHHNQHRLRKFRPTALAQVPMDIHARAVLLGTVARSMDGVVLLQVIAEPIAILPSVPAAARLPAQLSLRLPLRLLPRQSLCSNV